MPSFVSLVGYLLVFTFVAASFLLITLLVGKLVRPTKPNPEKDAIYECGEPTIGSSWVQFDLRFYVVALLFVIFDVEVAFFFPWAVLFGKTTRVADPSAEAPQVQVSLAEMGMSTDVQSNLSETHTSASMLARIAFVDLLVFFGVVLVGFAYLWKRGDLDWVRASLEPEPEELPRQTQPAPMVAERKPSEAAVA